MARYLDVHPVDPQPRAIAQAVQVLRDDGLLAYPTDSCYALGCSLGNKDALQRIRDIRKLDSKHDFTLVCRDFSQLDAYVMFDNSLFRVLKNATPGPYTFIMKASHETPRVMQNPKKKTVGVRIPAHPVALALVRELGGPLLSSTLAHPGAESPLTDGWQIKEELDHVLDAVVDAGDCGTEPTTVVDWSSGSPEIVRRGLGDPSRFE